MNKDGELTDLGYKIKYIVRLILSILGLIVMITIPFELWYYWVPLSVFSVWLLSDSFHKLFKRKGLWGMK